MLVALLTQQSAQHKLSLHPMFPSSTLTSWFYSPFTSIKLSCLPHLSKRTQFTKNPSFGYLTWALLFNRKIATNNKGDEYNLIYFKMK